jgi:septal ring factor EnvC (AmiA/AmiB activator)
MKIHIYIHGSGSEEIERFEILLDQLEKLEAQLKIDITKLQDALTRESALEAQLEALVQTGADPTLKHRLML